MWYEDKEQYVIADGLAERTWPTTLSLVHVFQTAEGDTITTKGWGEQDFMENYNAGKFDPERYLNRFRHGRAFGIIMRSVPLLCIDIDGKNGGVQSSRILQLPPTLAETSKSGEGYHLFYRLPDDIWDAQLGYAEFPDFNGIVPGVDIRATGIVYHYPQQRWNDRAIAPLSKGVRRLLENARASRLAARQQNAKLLTGEDAAIRADELLLQLERPFEEGQRNSRLFAWGCQAVRYVKDWEVHLVARGLELGLSERECVQIATSVLKYGLGSSDN